MRLFGVTRQAYYEAYSYEKKTSIAHLIVLAKHEFCCDQIYDSQQEARRSIHRAIGVYNQKWPHGSLDYFTPQQAHARQGVIQKRWKKLSETDSNAGEHPRSGSVGFFEVRPKNILGEKKVR